MKTALQWIERSRTGDKDAFARIVEQYQGMVSAVTFNVVGDFAQSEDLAQETFLTVWKKLPELREPEKLASWIYGIAKRTALHWHEKQRRNPLRGAAEVDDETAVDPRLEREQTRHRQEQSLELVWSTVRELPENLREPLLLYYRYSKSASDIAATMDVTEDVVYQRLSRGRKLLKAEVEKQVESVLEATRPDAAFTLAVLASLPLAALAGDAALAATTGTTAVGTGGATAGKVTGLAAFWAVIGPIAYFLWMFSFIFIIQWIQVRNAPTLNARRYRLYSVYSLSRYYLMFCCGMGLVSGGIFLFLTMLASIYDFTYPRSLPVFIAMVPIIPLTVAITQRSRKQFKNIIETDLGIAETPAKTYSNADVVRRIYSALFVNLLVVETLLGIALFLPLTDGSGGVIYLLVAVGI
ncbi:MAG: sigma-70 family RNA polymerase sigma factor, partial [Planctomycetaceae bacterium]|nr:sigma-70 family RNA polymerase sigma factor [Planctomycetaceae bacterium]